MKDVGSILLLKYKHFNEKSMKNLNKLKFYHFRRLSRPESRSFL